MAGRRLGWAGALLGLLLAGSLTAALFLAGEDGRDGARSGRAYRPPASTVKADLLTRVRPRPSCPMPEPRRAPGEDEEAIVYTTVEDACLVFRAEIVPADEAKARVAALRARDDVVSADIERPPPRPQTARASAAAGNLPWQYERLQGAQIERRWPPDAPPVTMAVIDTGINEEDNSAFRDTTTISAPWTRPAQHEKDGHGTEIAGLIAARRLDGAAGLVPPARVRLLDEQYTFWNTEKRNPDTKEKEPGWDFRIGPSIYVQITWAVNQDADVINMSFGGPEPNANTEAALRLAQINGTVNVGSAGSCHEGLSEKQLKDNGCTARNEPNYPGSYEDLVLSVAAIDENEARAPDSTKNRSVDVAAPGHKVPTRCLSERGPYGVFGQRNHTCEGRGTSAAAPMVSAAAAFLTAVAPDASPAEIKTALIKTARCDKQCPAEREAFGSGIIQPVEAADYLRDHTDPHESVDTGVAAAYTAQDPLTEAGAQGPPPTEAFLQLRDGSRVKFRGIAAPEAMVPGKSLAGPFIPTIELAFSPDGEIAAATDGRNLTVVRMIEGYPQRTIPCACDGLAFRPDGVLITWEGSLLTLFSDLSTGNPRRDISLAPHRGTAGSALGPGIVLAADNNHAYAFVQNPRSLEVSGDVMAIAYDGGLATPIAAAPSGVSEFATSEDGRYLAYPGRGDCSSGPRVVVINLASINYSTLKPAVELRDLRNPSGGHDLVSLRFEGDKLLAGWAKPDPAASLCAAWSAPDLYSADLAGSSGTGPPWQRVASEVAWRAGIPAFGELALEGVPFRSGEERYPLTVDKSDLENSNAPPHTLAKEVDQVLLRPPDPKFDAPPATISADEFAGFWKGRVDQPGARQPTYTIELRLTAVNGNEIAGSFDIPEANCGGKIEFQSLQGRELRFTDIITYGQTKCVSGGSVRFLLSPELDRAQRTWKATWQGMTLTSTATLRKVR